MLMTTATLFLGSGSLLSMMLSTLPTRIPSTHTSAPSRSPFAEGKYAVNVMVFPKKLVVPPILSIAMLSIAKAAMTSNPTFSSFQASDFR
jgi:hypothetical protein